jgi:hypothetical protein
LLRLLLQLWLLALCSACVPWPRFGGLGCHLLQVQIAQQQPLVTMSGQLPCRTRVILLITHDSGRAVRPAWQFSCRSDKGAHSINILHVWGPLDHMRFPVPEFVCQGPSMRGHLNPGHALHAHLWFAEVVQPLQVLQTSLAWRLISHCRTARSIDGIWMVCPASCFLTCVSQALKNPICYERGNSHDWWAAIAIGWDIASA